MTPRFVPFAAILGATKTRYVWWPTCATCWLSNASYNGLYHVLGGVISPIEGVSPNDLKIAQLVQRTQKEDIKEIILALPATIEGDTTNFYIFRQLSNFQGKISVISKGIAVGDALEFVDEVTLGRSIQNRIPFNQK